jgi:transposase
MDTEPFNPFDCREWRRMQAWRLNQLGWKPRDIATALSASKGAVSQWLAAARADGPQALQSQPSPGRPAQLTDQQRGLVPDFLWHGAEAYGFRGDVWTCARVAEVLKEEFGVSYSKSQVSRILKDLGWTPQVPITRAIQRDEDAIIHWREESWPVLRQRARRERRTPVFVDESGFYLLPGVVKTYGPKGETPIRDEWQTRDHLSVMGGLTPQGKVYVLVRPESLTGLHTVAFLQHLVRHAGRRLLVIWDGSPIHRRAAVREYLASPAGRDIHVERLPGYAPDLNPWDEGGWDHLKHVELRNRACRDLDELHLELHLAIGRLRQKPLLVRAFFRAAGLDLEKV